MNEFLSVAVYISSGLLALSAAMVMLRLLIGPTLADRVAAIDVISVLAVSIICVFIIVSRRTIYLDIIIALSLVTFLGTIAFAQFIEWQLGSSKEKVDE
jgi:multicomponent Na+:H+ antiporter subunit F